MSRSQRAEGLSRGLSAQSAPERAAEHGPERAPRLPFREALRGPTPPSDADLEGFVRRGKGHLGGLEAVAGLIGVEVHLVQDGRHGGRDLHLREAVAEATMRAQTEGRVDVGLLVLRPLRRVAVDVEALGLGEELRQVVGDCGRDHHSLAGWNVVARELEGVGGGADQQRRDRIHPHGFHRRAVHRVHLAQRLLRRHIAGEEGNGPLILCMKILNNFRKCVPLRIIIH